MTDAAANDGPEGCFSEDRDEALWQMIEALCAARDRGETADVEAFARERPELAEELRELWSAANLAGEVARIASDSSTTSDEGEENDTSSTIDVSLRSGEPAGESTPPLPERIGDYEIIDEIGRGGMGVVYRATQAGLDRDVALKAIRSGTLASSDDRTRFRQEAQSAARLEHPNIVSVYDVGESGGEPYFTMQLVEGTTLSAMLATTPLDAKEAARLLAAVARAVSFAHERGILHRDLKPANILIDEDGRPFVTDFGLAKRLEAGDSLTHSGAVLGTPSYMAPEQAAGSRGDVSKLTDVYALGAVLYHAITGRPPFSSASPVETILQVLEQDPLPPRLLNPQVDRDLEMIVLRCLQKPTDMRYASADALADDLEAYLSDEQLSARSGRFFDIISRMFRETHHAAVLQNWGVLWMWHSLVLFVLCLFTNWMQWKGVDPPMPYVSVWIFGLGAWAAIFWALRRRAGPVTFVERQIAHVWAGSIICCVLLYGVEMLLDLAPLTLTPVLGLFSGTVFLTKAAILTGRFYAQAVLLYAAVVPMALWPDYGLTIFGAVSAIAFFVPGWRYWRQNRVR